MWRAGSRRTLRVLTPVARKSIVSFFLDPVIFAQFGHHNSLMTMQGWGVVERHV